MPLSTEVRLTDFQRLRRDGEVYVDEKITGWLQEMLAKIRGKAAEPLPKKLVVVTNRYGYARQKYPQADRIIATPEGLFGMRIEPDEKWVLDIFPGTHGAEVFSLRERFEFLKGIQGRVGQK